jgi:hypothetical protein
VNPWVLSGNNVHNTTGNVGIGTATPNASAILDLSSSTQGVLIPRMTASQRAAIANPIAGLVVYQTNANPGNYVYNGSSWDVLSNANYGDVKTGMQANDHNGWVRLNGQAKSTLSASQQAQANLLGIGENLPNATDVVLMQSSGTLGSVTGSMDLNLVPNQLPNISPTITINSTVATMQSAGNHQHPINIVPNSTGGYAAGYPNAFKFEMFPNPINESYADITDRGNSSTYVTTAIIGSSGNHSHVIDSHNHTATSSSINGGVTQQSINITPKRLIVNTFIYLGL